MEIQNILVIIIGIISAIYIAKKLRKQFSNSDGPPACDKCNTGKK